MRSRYLLAALILALPAHATLLYNFDYVQSGGQVIQDFSFSFNSPTFIAGSGSNGVFPFNPFSVTDGSITFPQMTQDLADFNPIGPSQCFSFGSVAATLTPSCGGSANGGSILLVAFNPVPVTTGVYVPFYFAGQFGSDAADQIGSFSGSLQLTISGTADAVPEPSAAFLGASGIAVLAWRLRRRARFGSSVARI